MNQPPGDAPGRLPVDFRPRRLILLPYNDLLIDQGLDQFLSIDTSGFKLGLVLPYGMGPTEPKVFQMDAGGNLLVSMAGQAAAGAVRIQDGAGGTLAVVRGASDTAASAIGLVVQAQQTSFNGVTWDVSRSASAANLAVQLLKGIAVVASPGEWTMFGNPALGAVSLASQIAGGAGVRHVCTGYSIIVSSQAAPAAGTLTINLRDGASGAGIILQGFNLQIPAALYQPIVISRSGLSIVGSANTAMTIESTAAYAAVGVSLTLEGYDVS